MTLNCGNVLWVKESARQKTKLQVNEEDIVRVEDRLGRSAQSDSNS